MKDDGAGKWRLYLTFGLLTVAIAALCGRLAALVLVDGHKAADDARRQQRILVIQPGRPGNIYARTRGRYVLLAGSRQAPSCFVDPAMLSDGEIGDTAVRLASALNMDPLQVQDMLILRRTSRFVPIKRQITADEASAVKALKVPAVGIAHEWRRQYPCGQLASTVVGFRHADGIPGGGLELAQAPTFRATEGRRVLLGDVRRRPIWPIAHESAQPKDGNHVFLCLDAVVQGALERAVGESVERFEAQWGTGVVVDPQTGRILAMCSTPSFDPAEFNSVEPHRRVSRAVSLPFEPGSVVKPIFAAAAVDAGLINYETEISCENGVYRAHRGGTIRDHHPRGPLSLTEVVVHSSNIGMAKVGELLGNRRLWAVATGFGFGGKTGVALPAESKGILRDLSKWDGYSTRRVPFGHEISVTAVQLAMAFSALVNGGRLLEPRLIDQVRSPTGQVLWRSERRVVRQVLSPETSARTRAVLRRVVEQGTGRNCKLPFWTSLGKTGTAQVPGDGGYIEDAYTGTFVGGAPAEKPVVICLISIYRPDKSLGYYGSKVAAPYVRKVLQRTLLYLDVPPNKGGALAAR